MGSPFFNILNSFLGGRTIDGLDGSAYRFILYVILYGIYLFLLYFKISNSGNLIFSIVLGVLIMLYKIILWAINKFLLRSVSISRVEMKNIESNCPPDISENIWEMRDMLINPKPDLETVFNDLIGTGVDYNELMKLVHYIKDTPNIEESDEIIENENIISICGRIYTINLKKEKMDNIFQLNHSFIYCICAGIMGFVTSYLTLYLNDQFKNRERWWVALVIGSSIFSIIHPPFYEPFQTSINDCWSGLSRPVGLTLLSGIWIGLNKLEKNGKTITPFYDLTFNWERIAPYVHDICKWGIILFPIWVLGNMVGHPVSVVVSLIESVCRYVFGQNGVGGIPHMIIQLIRGGVSVVVVWLILEKKNNEIYISISLAAATFISLFPLTLDKNILNKIVKTIIGIIVGTWLAFLSPYLFTYVIKSDYSTIKWICFGCLIFSDVVYPYIESCNKYFLCYVLLLKPIPFGGIIREIFTQIFAPLFIASSILGSNLNNWYLSFIIVHSIYKAHSEPTIFAFAVFISVATLYYDFDFKDKSINLFISLIIASKAEAIYKVIHTIYNSRVLNRYFYDDWNILNDDYSPILNLLLYPLSRIISTFPSLDFILKVPSMIWGFITGGNLGVYLGIGYFTVPFSIRPYYFFDWPKTDETKIEDLFSKNIKEHPIEAPLYNSILQGLSKMFSDWVKAGLLGYVQVGDMFLIVSGNLSGFIHIISMEPNNIKIQFRGLEYKSQTICHEGESSSLQKLYDSFKIFPNFKHLNAFSNSSYELRTLNLSFESYDFSQTSLSLAFFGETKEAIMMGCFYCLCHQITKSDIDVNDIPEYSYGEIQNELVEKMRQVFEAENYNFNEEYTSKYMMLWETFKEIFFDANGLKTEEVAKCFKNELTLGENFEWVYISDEIYTNIILKTLYLSTGVNFLNSLNIGYGENADIATEVIPFLNEFNESYVVAPIHSSAFSKAFKQKDKTILSVSELGGTNSIVRFFLSKEAVWHVFQINQEYVRALWSNECHDILFHLNDEPERISIQENVLFLNNHIIQSCDLPVGYPAYVSSIVNSFSTPYDTCFN